MRRRLLAPLLLALVACGSDSPPPAPVGTPGAPRRKAETPVAPVAANSVDYSYLPIGKRDPFRATALDLAQAGPEKADEVVCDEPLCKVDLDELIVVGVVSGDANPLAMVEDRNGVGYVVRRNSKIGRQGGKVSQVLRDCIVVTSFITGADGKGQANKANLCVRQDPQSQAPMDLFQGKPFQ
jgi:type IV pilus assembly protein PilP